MQPTPVFTKVFNDYTYHFFLEPVDKILGYTKDLKASSLSISDDFSGHCGEDIYCSRCPFNELGDCSDPHIFATKVPELVQLYPEYFI